MNEPLPLLVHMDTNFLIRACDHNTSQQRKLIEHWVANLVGVWTSTPAWMEFRRDSARRKRQHNDVLIFRQSFNEQIIAFDEVAAERAAWLFNKMSRPTSDKMRLDIMIAASAMVCDAEVATNDPHFDTFVQHGLRKANLDIDL